MRRPALNNQKDDGDDGMAITGDTSSRTDQSCPDGLTLDGPWRVVVAAQRVMAPELWRGYEQNT